MKILVIGAGGMIGRKLVEALLASGTLGGKSIRQIIAYDLMEPEFASDDISIASIAGDFCATC